MPKRPAVVVREERPADAHAVHIVNERAFGRAEEALLVGTLRAAGGVILSLVAESEGAVVGHILFTPVSIERMGSCRRPVGLGPLAVLPEFQRQGIGARLVREGLERLRGAGHDAAVVVGHPGYYPRFGFVPGGPLGLRWEYDSAGRAREAPETPPPDAFMVCELRPGALAGCAGVVRYRAEFTGL